MKNRRFGDPLGETNRVIGWVYGITWVIVLYATAMLMILLARTILWFIPIAISHWSLSSNLISMLIGVVVGVLVMMKQDMIKRALKYLAEFVHEVAATLRYRTQVKNGQMAYRTIYDFVRLYFPQVPDYMGVMVIQIWHYNKFVNDMIDDLYQGIVDEKPGMEFRNIPGYTIAWADAVDMVIFMTNVSSKLVTLPDWQGERDKLNQLKIMIAAGQKEELVEYARQILRWAEEFK